MNLKFLAAGAVGAGVGAVVSWAITADRAQLKAQKLEKSFEQMEDKLRTRSRDAARLELENKVLNDRVDELEHQLLQGEAAPEEIDSSGEVDYVAVEEEPFPPGESPAETKARLVDQIREYNPNIEDVENIAEAGRRVIESTRFDPPFVISQQTYNWDETEEGDDYSKVTLTYFETHRVLLDEDQDTIPHEEIDQMIGWKNLGRFGDESGDMDIVYIRNRRMDTDFEVVRETEEPLPLHVRAGLPKDEFELRRSAGWNKFREGDV